jgi:serine/threonine-protein kinase HipA
MNKLSSLEVFLYDEKIGSITQLPGDKNSFSFTPQYIDNASRPTLSLSFKDRWGELITDIKPTRTRLSPFFSNLLPEGPLRAYLTSLAKISTEREFYLLQALGNDLPGAITIRPTQFQEVSVGKGKKPTTAQQPPRVLHFSLAGVQLKFSAIWEKGGRLTIPVDGVGGSWIVKPPSSTYPGVPENEYTMMGLARQMGMNVPDTALIPLEQITGIPTPFKSMKAAAFAILRFDRTADKKKIHIEDLAQVFGVYPEKKYGAANYKNIAELIWKETGEKGLIEFIQRFVFNALIGNGDMHLKNWSLIYPDKRTPHLAPAYDFVSTLPYLPGDTLALNFAGSKAFSSLTLDQFKRFAIKGGFSEALILDTVHTTVQQFKTAWKSVGDYPLDPALVDAIETHFKALPIYTQL